MNHLAHLFLAGGNPDLLIGGFLGDHVKGRLKGERNIKIEQGIALHRSIDVFTDAHDMTRQSQSRFQRQYRRYSGIMTDIIYDHFLALDWYNYHPQDLQSFSNDTFSILLDNVKEFPRTAAHACQRMYDYNALAGYTKDKFIERSFIYLSGRLTRENPLANGFRQFVDNREELHADFEIFFPQLMIFVGEWKKNADIPPPPA